MPDERQSGKEGTQMKKQMAVLIGSLTLVILLAVILVVLMTRPQQEQPQESNQLNRQEELELMALTVEQINTISVENPAGGFVLVNQGSGFVVEGYEEVATSGINVNNLTANFTSLQAERLLLSPEELTVGSSNELLGQYGLEKPTCHIQIVTTDGSTEQLLLGNRAPDGSSVYALYQDSVYLLDDRLLDSASKGRLSFLDNQITDMEPEYEQAIITLSGAVRSSPVTLEIQTKEQSTEEEEEQSVVSSTEKIYTLTTPLIQTISAESAAQVTEGLFSLYGNSVVAVQPTAQQMAEYRLDEPYSVVSMQVDGVHAFTLKTSEPDTNNYVYLMREGSPLVYLVSASRLSWLEVQAEQLTQSIYQPSEPEEVAQLQVISPKESYDFVVQAGEEDGAEQVSCNGQPVDSELFGKLYQTVTSIPPERMSSGQPELEPALTMVVSYRDTSRPQDRFELIPNGSGSVYLRLNGKIRYTASQQLVYQILQNCQRAVEGKEVSPLN